MRTVKKEKVIPHAIIMKTIFTLFEVNMFKRKGIVTAKSAGDLKLRPASANTVLNKDMSSRKPEYSRANQ